MQQQFIWISKAISAAPNYQWQIGMRLSATMLWISIEDDSTEMDKATLNDYWEKGGGYSLFAFFGGISNFKVF